MYTYVISQRWTFKRKVQCLVFPFIAQEVISYILKYVNTLVYFEMATNFLVRIIY